MTVVVEAHRVESVIKAPDGSWWEAQKQWAAVKMSPQEILTPEQLIPWLSGRWLPDVMIRTTKGKSSLLSFTVPMEIGGFSGIDASCFAPLLEQLVTSTRQKTLDHLIA
jgi:hypothetical protein